MNQEKLTRYIDQISDFESLEDKEQILMLCYYLQNEEKVQYLKSSDIKECYNLLDIPQPNKIHSKVYELKRDGKLILRGIDRYRLTKSESDKIKQSVQIKNQSRMEKVYNPEKIYVLYRDIKEIIQSAKNEVFVIDAYAHEDIINLYLDELQIGIKIMILTERPKDNFTKIARKFKQKHKNNFEVKTNKGCHDRLLFVDKKCYVIGQSIEKAAETKPTYLCEVHNSGKFRDVFQKLYDSGKKIDLGS